MLIHRLDDELASERLRRGTVQPVVDGAPGALRSGGNDLHTNVEHTLFEAGPEVITACNHAVQDSHGY